MANPLDLASALLGKREVPDRGAIREYLRNGGVNLDPATTAWCAAFVNSTLQQAGMKGTGSNLARSFLNYGSPVTQPRPGDIAVFSRGDPNGPQGHVGFVQGVNPNGTISLLAGNQGNAVSVQNYDTKRLLGYRRPGGFGDSQTHMLSPTPMAEQPGAAGPAPPAFGDLVAPQPAQTASAPALAFGSYLAQMQERQKAEEDARAANQTRRAALFGGSLFGPFG
ncbi:TIGR02594 family protein [Aurantimonas sp. MSK8Z-1]|uniref:TIGR02594 family protein n=1 Tax=Mangrovibrevibacter kandeliae TaxID=2968473 RepID=UPI0021189033|nr:TIGR02594 family protein [Aurantimonas sp. MSK8Z-1]MCW4115677.1 TIGR02594 family protein [Aurantimonas sp. MSK8Z-1]